MANASQFIGSKISLISKAEIRYEGILYSLDLQEATISLAKVRSFGTEDRPTEKPVPPKDEVYEFIIFRGSDIKGIDVIEPPKAAPSISGGLPNDPAIVEVSHYHTAAQQQQQQYSHGGNSLPFGAATTIMGKPPAHNNFFDGLIGRSNVSTPSAYGSSRKSPTNEAGTQANRNRQDGRRRGGQQRQGGQMSPQQNRQQNNQNQNNNMQQRRGQNNNQGFMPRGGRGNFNNNRGNNQGGGGGYQGQQQNRGGRGQSRPRGNRTPGVFQVPANAKVTFDEAFDFEKANAELETALSKLKLEKTTSGEKKEGSENVNGEGPTEQDEQENKEPAVFYQKDNFFDNISCEALERSKGKVTRVDWKAEKKLNVETFGASANGPRYGGYRGGFRGRGGYYGGGGNYGYGNNYRGGQGGYQPRYGGYNSYNRFGSGGGRGGGISTGNNGNNRQQ